MARFEKAIALHIDELRRYVSAWLGNTGEPIDLVRDCLTTRRVEAVAALAPVGSRSGGVVGVP